MLKNFAIVLINRWKVIFSDESFSSSKFFNSDICKLLRSCKINKDFCFFFAPRWGSLYLRSMVSNCGFFFLQVIWPLTEQQKSGDWFSQISICSWESKLLVHFTLTRIRHNICSVKLKPCSLWSTFLLVPP